MIATIGSLVLKGETIMSLSIQSGGYATTKYISERLGLEHHNIPVDNINKSIHWNELEYISKAKKVKMMYCDLMNVNSLLNIRRIRNMFESSTIICYDALHVLGLIMGDTFQHPLDGGADIIIGYILYIK